MLSAWPSVNAQLAAIRAISGGVNDRRDLAVPLKSTTRSDILCSSGQSKTHHRGVALMRVVTRHY